MRILYVITSTETGGAEKALVDLSKKMLQAGHTVKVLCLNPLGAEAVTLKKAGVEVKAVFSKWPGRQIRAIRKEIEQFNPDVIHAMLFRAIQYTRLACAGKTIPLITTPHFDFAKRPFFYRWTDCLLKEKDTLTVAESLSTASYLVSKQHYQKDKVYLLPNEADKTLFFRDDALRVSWREKYGFHVKTTVFMCVARLARVKDPLLLLQAFRNIQMRDPEARLVYVGEGESRPLLEQYIHQAGLKEKVILAGQQENINAFLNMADVFVLPSLEESLPFALLEAIQVGLPCIVSRVGDMPRRVKHGENGFVFPPGDVTLLSCFMAELLNTEVRKQMAAASMRIASQTEDIFSKYEHIYQQVVNSFHVKTK